MEDTNTMSSVTVNGGGAENAVPEKTPMSGGRRAALIAGILLGVLAVAYLAACVVTQTVYGSTAFPHTDVLGLDVSKLTAQQIETLWEEKSPQLLHDTAVSLTEKGERIGDVPLDTLGVTVTPQFEAKNPQGNVIPNLYVVGQDIGGLYDSSYDLRCEGSASSFAMTSGRVAAENAIKAIEAGRV